MQLQFILSDQHSRRFCPVKHISCFCFVVITCSTLDDNLMAFLYCFIEIWIIATADHASNRSSARLTNRMCWPTMAPMQVNCTAYIFFSFPNEMVCAGNRFNLRPGHLVDAKRCVYFGGMDSFAGPPQHIYAMLNKSVSKVVTFWRLSRWYFIVAYARELAYVHCLCLVLFCAFFESVFHLNCTRLTHFLLCHCRWWINQYFGRVFMF